MNRRAQLFFLVYLCIVAYFSLYPFQFTSEPHQAGLVWLPIQNFSDAIDFILNVLLYIPLGALGIAALPGNWIGFFAISAACGAISYGIENSQLFIDGRSGDLRDLLANTLGGLAGAAGIIAARRPAIGSRLRAIQRDKLLCCAIWVLWQASLLVPR